VPFEPPLAAESLRIWGEATQEFDRERAAERTQSDQGS
jgi:hypothetical protein